MSRKIEENCKNFDEYFRLQCRWASHERNNGDSGNFGVGHKFRPYKDGKNFSDGSGTICPVPPPSPWPLATPYATGCNREYGSYLSKGGSVGVHMAEGHIVCPKKLLIKNAFIYRFLTMKKLIFENLSRLRRLSAPQANIFVQILVNLDKKSAKMFIFFVKRTKFSRAPSVRENYLKTT